MCRLCSTLKSSKAAIIKYSLGWDEHLDINVLLSLCMSEYMISSETRVSKLLGGVGCVLEECTVCLCALRIHACGYTKT